MAAAWSAQVMLMASAATGVLAFPMTVVNKIGENVLCHTDILTVFVAYDHMDVANGDSVTFDTAGGFGVQENGWYWRGDGAKASEQNPDNAGMQIDVAAGSCNAQTSASWGGGAVPDAQRLLYLNSFADGAGGCTVEVYRKADTDLCVAGSGSKTCCAPCSVFPGGNCCTKESDGGETTCPSPSPGPSYYKTITPSSNTNLCLDLPGDDSSDGNPLWLWECNGQESQRWVFDNYQIRFGADESKCIDAGDMSNGMQLFLWDCNGYPQQTWGFDFDASRVYLVDTSICLDLYGDWQLSGQPLHVWDCSGDWNQEWSLWNVESIALNVAENGTNYIVV